MSVLTGESERVFLPGMGLHWLLPLYDPLTRLLGVDRSRRTLLDQAVLRPGDRVLDVGCGTGSLAIGIQQRNPEVQVVGVDPDTKALARARRKAERARVSIQFDRGFADALAYPDGSFDLGVSSFMLHHLEREGKRGMLREIRRVLKPGGRFHLVDFGDVSSRSSGSTIHRLHDNAEDRVLACMNEVGLADARIVGSRSLLGGLLPVVYYQAASPTAKLEGAERSDLQNRK